MLIGTVGYPYPSVVMRRCRCGKAKTYGAGAKFCEACVAKKDKAYVSSLLGKYGLTPTEYQALLSVQGNTCYVCLRAPGTRRLCVDHDHATGKVRGLLCSKCNVYLGHLRDSIEAAERLVTYLKRARD